MLPRSAMRMRIDWPLGWGHIATTFSAGARRRRAAAAAAAAARVPGRSMLMTGFFGLALLTSAGTDGSCATRCPSNVVVRSQSRRVFGSAAPHALPNNERTPSIAPIAPRCQCFTGCCRVAMPIVSKRRRSQHEMSSPSVQKRRFPARSEQREGIPGAAHMIPVPGAAHLPLLMSGENAHCGVTSIPLPAARRSHSRIVPARSMAATVCGRSGTKQNSLLPCEELPDAWRCRPRVLRAEL